MSMEIDFTTPLTDEERAFLDSRGRYADIERADSINGVETPEYGAGDGTGLQQQSVVTSEMRAGELERLKARIAELEGESEEDDGADDGALPPYEDWNVKDLDAELKERKLSTAGTKPEKADRLYADDESKAAFTTPAQ